MNMAMPLEAAVFTWLFSFAHLLFYESKDKKKVRTMLSQYVSPAVLTEVVDKYEDFLTAEIGCKERVSIFFSDIRGFTQMAETLAAEDVVAILNIYFTSVTNSIFEHKGTIDKFIGDATMAFWGAPIKTQTHALDAVRAALDMLKNLPNINQMLKEKNYPAVNIGIGINTGPVVLGNIGSEKKLDYTIIGDNVNLASRLEGLTKQYQCQLIVSEYTYAEIKEHIPCRVVDFVRVKGKRQPIKIYAPVLVPDEQGNEGLTISQDICRKTETAFNDYVNRQWRQAMRHYQELPEDGIQKTFVHRCQSFLQNEPGEAWDGIYTLESK
jgi:adenylate cyclase